MWISAWRRQGVGQYSANLLNRGYLITKGSGRRPLMIMQFVCPCQLRCQIKCLLHSKNQSAWLVEREISDGKLSLNSRKSTGTNRVYWRTWIVWNLKAYKPSKHHGTLNNLRLSRCILAKETQWWIYTTQQRLLIMASRLSRRNRNFIAHSWISMCRLIIN